MKKEAGRKNVERKKWIIHLFYVCTWWVLKILQMKLEGNLSKIKKTAQIMPIFAAIAISV